MYLFWLLKGSVSNNEEGVIIYITGIAKNVHSFYQCLIESPPKVSKIKNHFIQEIELKNFHDFQIIPSQKSGKLNLQLTPDFAICDDCKNEIYDSANRRYYYPFTTCVNCGPRWAITNTFPFERDHTSIDEFEMCETCQNEYSNPADRRFHSQTNSCSTCGISILITNAQGLAMNIKEEEVYKKTASLIKKGNIIAIKNTGGYLLCCDAGNKEIVNKLRKKKKRPNKPFAVLYPSIELLENELKVSPQQKKALTSSERPIVIISKSYFDGDLALQEIAPNLNQLGVMLPYSGILQLLANELDKPIVATSGNLHGSPIISNNEKAKEVLADIADYFLHHNLKITNPQDDSVIKYSFKFEHEVLFRRSRGFAPNYFNAEIKTDEKIMALGAHLKSTIAYLPNDYLYISQYLGNLDHYDVYERFTKTALNFNEIFEQRPDILLVDKHPSYHSTQYGFEVSKKWQAEIFQIQHHKAHFTSVLGEHELFDESDSILGVIWDGTGFGEDGNIWGGEFFTYHTNIIERLAHFEYFNWLAGDKMAKEPRLSFLSLADSEMTEDLLIKFSSNEFRVYQSLKKTSKLKTSSVGRLFDAVASILDICDINTYEGEAAILLENYVTTYELDSCKTYCTVLENGIVPTSLLLKNLYFDLKNGASKEKVIINFLYTLSYLIYELADQKELKKIALSGGVFQNTVLIDMLKEMGQNKYELFFNLNLAPNDENISYGQIQYYLNCK
jgi:hydrogenase maturation protein HypF